MGLPQGSHGVRLCSFSALDENGDLTVACFTPHPATDERPAELYLSLHWLEYLGLGSFPECLARLRAYLLASPYPKERKPTTKGKVAVMCCEDVVSQAALELQIGIDFAHEPRLPNVATSIEVSEQGQITRFGIAPQQAAELGQTLDPHCGLYTLPEEAAHQLAVQQFLVSTVIHTELGRL